jgi:hypothetical protein
MSECAHEDGMAIGRRLHHASRGDVGGGACAVLDHHVLAQDLAHRNSYEARHGVHRAAGRKAHQQLDRPVRPGLCPGRAHDGCSQHRGGTGKKGAALDHRESPVVIVVLVGLVIASPMCRK